jgi:hypothetical protein
MDHSFREGFEKTAYVGALARIGSLAAGLGKKGIQSVVKGAKNVGTKAMKDPMKAGGSLLTGGMVAMEGANVLDKARKAATTPSGRNLTQRSFYSVRR